MAPIWRGWCVGKLLHVAKCACIDLFWLYKFKTCWTCKWSWNHELLIAVQSPSVRCFSALSLVLFFSITWLWHQMSFIDIRHGNKLRRVIWCWNLEICFSLNLCWFLAPDRNFSHGWRYHLMGGLLLLLHEGLERTFCNSSFYEHTRSYSMNEDVFMYAENKS